MDKSQKEDRKARLDETTTDVGRNLPGNSEKRRAAISLTSIILSQTVLLDAFKAQLKSDRNLSMKEAMAVCARMKESGFQVGYPRGKRKGPFRMHIIANLIPGKWEYRPYIQIDANGMVWARETFDAETKAKPPVGTDGNTNFFVNRGLYLRSKEILSAQIAWLQAKTDEATKSFIGALRGPFHPDPKIKFCCTEAEFCLDIPQEWLS